MTETDMTGTIASVVAMNENLTLLFHRVITHTHNLHHLRSLLLRRILQVVAVGSASLGSQTGALIQQLLIRIAPMEHQVVQVIPLLADRLFGSNVLLLLMKLFMADDANKVLYPPPFFS